MSGADISLSTFEEVLVSGAKLDSIKGFSEAIIKSINIGSLDNPIILKGEDAKQWMLTSMKESL